MVVSSHRTYLIVSDNQQERARWMRALAHTDAMPARMVSAHDGAEALAAYADAMPDAVVISTTLPDMPCATLLEQLWRKHGSLAAVLVGEKCDSCQQGHGAEDVTVAFHERRTAGGAALRSTVGTVVQEHALTRHARELETRLAAQQHELDTLRTRTNHLLDGMSDGYFALDDQWRFTALNWKAEALFGRSRAQLLGKSIWDIFPPHTSHDVFAKCHTHMQHAVQEGTTEAFELFVPWAMAWYEMRAVPLVDGLSVYARDVTHEKSIVAALQGNEPQIRRLVDANIVGIMTADLEGRIIEANDITLNLIGYTREDLEAERIRWTTLTPPEFYEQDARALEELHRTGIARPYEKAYIHRDGHLIQIVIGAAILDEDVGTMIAFILDISERKKIENALKQRNRENATLMKNIPDIITRFNRDYQHMFVSPAIERITGIPPEKYIGKTNTEMGVPAEQVASWHEHIETAFVSGKEERFEFSYVTSAGIRHFEATMIPEPNEHGAAKTVLGITRDITLQKRSQDSLRFLDEVSTTLGTSLDVDEIVQQVAHLAATKFGEHSVVMLHADDGSLERAAEERTTESDAFGWLEARISSKADVPFGPAEVMRTGRTELVVDATAPMLPYAECALKLLREHHVASMMTVPMQIGSRLLGTLSLAAVTPDRHYDETDLQLAEELARRTAVAIDNARLYQTAHEAVRERDAFLSVTAHEVKNPLSTILGHAQLLERRARLNRHDPDRDSHDVRVIVEQTRRATTLLGDLSNASLFESGLLKVASDPINLWSLIRNVMDRMQPSLSGHILMLDSVSEQLIVSGDSARLEQVFHNLLGNAVKYSPNGGTISVEVTTDNRMACIAVRDNGIGIPTLAIPSLFKRFFRVRTDSTQYIAGSGLGLFVVKEIVALHGGTIEVESVEGVGSTFSVELPLFTTGISTLESSGIVED